MNNNWLKTIVPLAALAILAPASALAITNSSKDPSGKPSRLDPVYGVCRGVDPGCYSDWGTERDNKVLVYSRTAGPRHGNLGRVLDPDNPGVQGLGLPRPYVITQNHSDPASWPRPLDSSNVAQAALVRMLTADGIEVHVTEDVQAMERLNSSYKAVIFMSPTRDTLWNHARGAQGGTRLDWARESLRKYIQGGGGFVGIHNAFGTEYGWQWYEGLLGNANYYNHGRSQPGDVVVVNDRDVSTRNLPRRWGFSDEWYNLVPFPTDVNFLATVDERTLAGGAGGEGSHPGHGGFHPVTWCQYYDGGRSWVTTLGHEGAAFQENSAFPGAAEFQAHIRSGIRSAMGDEPFCTPARRKP
jgi:type 1 glutamine amidotransferase